MTARAATMSMIVNKDCGRLDRRMIGCLQAADGTVTLYTHHGSRQHAASLSRARRAIQARGYEVETFGVTAGPLAGRHYFYLRVYGKKASS